MPEVPRTLSGVPPSEVTPDVPTVIATRSAVASEVQDASETELEAPQVEWVRRGIEARYDRTRLVNSPLFDEEGVPAFPDKEAALKSTLNQLTREQVAYMMEEGRSPFMFQMKLVAPGRVDLLRTLINEQPRWMSTPQRTQQDLMIMQSVERHLASQPAGKTEWKWEFVQGAQIIKPQREDDVILSLADRVERVKLSRPKGMRGTDLFTLATLMADGLAAGKPLDILFENGAMYIKEYKVLNFTLMDEEGELSEGQRRTLVGGKFDPNYRCAYVRGYFADKEDDAARLRSSVEGSIEDSL